MKDKVTGAVLQDLIPFFLYKHMHRAGTDSICLYLKRGETLIVSLCSVLCWGLEKVFTLFYPLCSTDVSSVPSTTPQLDCRAHKSLMML